MVGMDYSLRWGCSWGPWVFLGRFSTLAASFVSIWRRWMARGFIYFVAFVLSTVIDYRMTWTTWCSLACASGRLLAFLAWLHLLRRLRGPCGALLHDGVGCSELDGWCSLTSSCFVGADAGPLRQSWRRWAWGPLCPARAFNLYCRLRAPCGDLRRDGLDYLELFGWCFLVPSRFLDVASPTSASS